jgi:hypothetical protein
LGIAAYGVLLISATHSKRLGIFGVVASLLAVAVGPLPWIDPSLEPVAYALYLPVMAWQLVLGISLVHRRVILRVWVAPKKSEARVVGMDCDTSET